MLIGGERESLVGEIIVNASNSQLYMDRYENGLIARSRVNMNSIRAVGRRIRVNEDRILEERTNSIRNFIDPTFAA